MSKIIKLIVDKNNENKRVDSFISKKEKEVSRTRIKNLILDGFLKINKNKASDPDKKIKVNDIVELEIPDEKKINIKPFKYKVDIIFEDNDILVINKPSGLIVHPGAGNYDNTLVNALIDYSNLSNVGGESRPGIVHRIDKDTSGLIVIAKNNFVHEELAKQFKNHTIERKYVALVWGKLRPQKGRIESLITRSNKNRQLMEASLTKGKKAITDYKTLETYENKNVPTLSLIECQLKTGRTHQIRVHMSYKKNYIVGDKLYKKKFKKLKNINKDLEVMLTQINRQFLHAKSLGFVHPVNNKKIYFETKLPKELQKIAKKLRFISV